MISHEPTPDGRLFCRVCGEGVPPALGDVAIDRARCGRHLSRHACAIEGCARSTARRNDPRVRTDIWICAEHWRRFCPPRSRRRRAYHAFFREAKRRGGFDDGLTARFWRFWYALLGSARARDAAGTANIAEIHRIMGWEA